MARASRALKHDAHREFLRYNWVPFKTGFLKRFFGETRGLSVKLISITSRSRTRELDIQGVAKKKNETRIQNFISRILIRLSKFCKLHCIHLPFVQYWLIFQIKRIKRAGSVAFQKYVAKFLLDMSKK